ncbi:MAG: hypothetical protein ACPG7F_20025, partial [Aggregatilineales bacterium]
MWMIAMYRATSLFSLKPATATASGGRTLLVPTPYAIKMALLDVMCRLIGQAAAGAAWDDWLGQVDIALRPAQAVVVNNTFIRILRPPKKAKPGQPFQRTIAYREYAQLAGDFGIALLLSDDAPDDVVALAQRAFVHVNYLGKRGGFVQLQAVPQQMPALPDDFLQIGDTLKDGFALDAVLTQLDDTGEKATFEVVNIYNRSKRITSGKHRVLHHVALPYERVKSSRGYTHYRLRR